MSPNTRIDLSQMPVYRPGASDAPGSTVVVKLSSNESALGPSPLALEAYQQASRRLYRYPDPSSQKLRDALAEHNGLDAQRIVCGVGSESLTRLITRVFAGAGDDVVISQHAFSLYKVAAFTVGARPIFIPENDCVADLDAMAAAATPETRIIYLANPNNPTGTVHGRTAVTNFVDAIPDDVLVVLDSAYAEYVDDSDYENGLSFVKEGRENVLVMRTFSKVYGLAGLRVGWSYSSQEIADSLRKVNEVFSVSVPAQSAAVSALADQAHVQAELDHIAKWRPWMTREIEKLGLKVTPSVGNFVLAHCDSQAIAAFDCIDRLLAKGIIVRPVASYGLPDSMRITISTESDNRSFIEGLAGVLSG